MIFVTLFIGWFIWNIILWGRGQSPGKQILRMRVMVLETRMGASWGTMFIREFVGRWLLGLIPFYTFVSAIFILIDDRNQALWDKVAKTVVVNDDDGILKP